MVPTHQRAPGGDWLCGPMADLQQTPLVGLLNDFLQLGVDRTDVVNLNLNMGDIHALRLCGMELTRGYCHFILNSMLNQLLFLEAHREAACFSFTMQVFSGKRLNLPAQVCALTVTRVFWTLLTYSFNLDSCC